MSVRAIVVHREADVHALALRQLMPYIATVARRMVPDDPDLFEDVVQEGLVAVWEMDTSRFEDADEGYVKRRAAKRMATFMRRERLQPVAESSLSLEELGNEFVTAER